MLSSGTIIHERYQIESLVGQGAMGAVYAATDLRLGHTVALKHTRIPGPAGAAALDREAQILTHLAHPNLPAVTDTFVAAEGQCLVMTYVPGPTLADLLEEWGTGFAPATVLAWADQILTVLDYLHSQQPPVLHRDIKPQNLKLTPEGQVILLDFGLARGQLFQTRIAGQRSVVGYTLPYAPLEQIRGEDTDPRSDLFALASTLYHLLLSTPPPDALARAAALIAGQPDPLTRPLTTAGLPPRLSTVLATTLTLDPSGRPDSAATLRSALSQAGHPAVAEPDVTARRRRRPWLLADGAVFSMAILLVTIALTIVALLADGMGRASTSADFPTPTPFGPTATTVPPLPIAAAAGWAPYGSSTIPPGPTPAPNPDVVIPQVTIGPEAPLQPAGLVATSTVQGIHTPDPAGGSLPLLGKIGGLPAPLPGLAFGANHQTLFVATSQGVMMLDREAQKPLAELQVRLEAPGELVASPDGRLLAATVLGGVQIWEVADGTPRAFLGHVPPIQALTFTPDSRRMLTGSEGGWLQVWDVESGEPVGQTWAGQGDAGPIQALAVTPDDTTVIAVQGSAVRLWQADGRLLRTIPGEFDERAPGITGPKVIAMGATGNLLAIGYADGRIILMGMQDGAVRQTLNAGEWVRTLTISPGGKWLAAGTYGGQVRLWRLADGALFELRDSPSSAIVGLAIDPGEQIVAASAIDGTVHFWAIPP